MEIEKLLTTTRSARKSLDLEAPVDRDDVRECLRIALQAANGSNQQAWRWLAVFDADRRARVAEQYRDAYLSVTGGRYISADLGTDTPNGRIMSSTEWLVEHLHEVPLLVIPCYEPYLRRSEHDEAFQAATLWGSIFPPVWNFQLALHSRGYGTCITTLHLFREAEVREILGIPESYVQGCLLPVARLRPGTVFTPPPRRPLEQVVATDAWDGPPL